jgi:hypothetical protein
MAPNVAQIFDALSLPDFVPVVPGGVPLSHSMPGLNEQRYWRLPVKQGVILSLLMQQAVSLPVHNRVEVQLAQAIYAILTLQILDLDTGNNELGHPGPSGPGGAGRGDQGGARQKRMRDKDDRGSRATP